HIMARNFLPSLRSPHEGNLHGYFLPKAEIDLTIDGGGQMTINGTEYVPDPQHQYFFQYRPSPFTDDDITICYGENGFLSKVHTIVDDQTDDFVSRIFDVGEALVAGPLTNSRVVPLFAGKIDPFNPEHQQAINSQLQPKGFTFEAKILGDDKRQGVNPQTVSKTGIFVKPRAIAELSITSSAGKRVKHIHVPHPHLLEMIEIPSAPFVKTEFELEFDAHGYPTIVKIKKPSSALAFVDLPLKIIRAVLALPGQLVQMRINIDNTRATSLQSKYQYDQKRLEIEQKMAQLEVDTKKYRLEQAAKVQQEPEVQQGSVDSAEMETLKADLKKLQQEVRVMKMRSNA
ncbi:MAG: hypothetical protein AAFR59_15610, partial [Bacteroidota bacterium]